MIKPLHVPNVPMVSKSGNRDNVEALIAAVQSLVAPGTIVDCLIEHDDACPCAVGNEPITECTCETVDITLRALPKAEIEKRN